MSDLASSSDLERWKKAYDSYSERIRIHSKSSKRRANLVELDAFARLEIPERVKGRYSDENEDTIRGYLTKEEICKIVEWKITVRFPGSNLYRGLPRAERQMYLHICEQRGKFR